MNYELHYQRLVNRAPRQRPKGVYLEKHHIIPRCLGGTNEKINLCYLTPEEHYVAHQLLVKIYPNNKKLVFACWQMNQSPNGNGERVNNRIYGWLKRAHSKAASERSKGNSINKGRTPWNKGLSGITNMPESMKESTRQRMLGNTVTKGMKFPDKKVTFTIDQRKAAAERMKKLAKGVKWTPERIAKRTASRLRNKVAA